MPDQASRNQAKAHRHDAHGHPHRNALDYQGPGTSLGPDQIQAAPQQPCSHPCTQATCQDTYRATPTLGEKTRCGERQQAIRPGRQGGTQKGDPQGEMLDQRNRAGDALAHHRPAGDLDQGKQRHRRQEHDQEGVFDLVGPAALFRFFHEKTTGSGTGLFDETRCVTAGLHRKDRPERIFHVVPDSFCLPQNANEPVWPHRPE